MALNILILIFHCLTIKSNKACQSNHCWIDLQMVHWFASAYLEYITLLFWDFLAVCLVFSSTLLLWYLFASPFILAGLIRNLIITSFFPSNNIYQDKPVCIVVLECCKMELHSFALASYTVAHRMLNTPDKKESCHVISFFTLSPFHSHTYFCKLFYSL